MAVLKRKLSEKIDIGYGVVFTAHDYLNLFVISFNAPLFAPHHMLMAFKTIVNVLFFLDNLSSSVVITQTTSPNFLRKSMPNFVVLRV